MAGEIPTVTLNSGHKMPVVGLGTVAANIPANAASIFFDAIQVGYRHFDTAALYGTEVPLGQAVAEAIRTGLIGSRHELFITTKLWCDDAHHDLVVPALNKSLTNLGLEFVDLYLVHWPVRILKKSGGEVRGVFPKEDVLPFDMKGTWEAMEECQRLGLAKSIGVSNFSTKKLQQLLEHAAVPPSVNQVEMNTSWNQKKLRNFCEEKGIHITAWSPLGANGASWGTASVMESPVLKEIACRKGKTVAQVALRWLYEQGVSMVVKSFNRERMRQNLDIFGWELNQEELDMMAKFPQHRAFDGNKFVSPDGPYKSFEELWDGEI